MLTDRPFGSLVREDKPVKDLPLIKSESEDKRPKSPPFNGPKFLGSGSSARLQGT